MNYNMEEPAPFPYGKVAGTRQTRCGGTFFHLRPIVTIPWASMRPNPNRVLNLNPAAFINQPRLSFNGLGWDVQTTKCWMSLQLKFGLKIEFAKCLIPPFSRVIFGIELLTLLREWEPRCPRPTIEIKKINTRLNAGGAVEYHFFLNCVLRVQKPKFQCVQWYNHC